MFQEIDQKRKNLIAVVLVLALIVLAGAHLAYKKGYLDGLLEKKSAISLKNNPAPIFENKTESGRINESNKIANNNLNDNADDSLDEEDLEGKRSSEKADENLRQGIVAHINKNLNSLVSPPKNDKWDIPIFYFVGNSYVYVELYGFETDLTGLKLLYKVEKKGNDFKIVELARYSEGEEDWNFVSGKDDFTDYIIEEYDLNEDNNRWEKTDEFTEESVFDEENVFE